MKDSMAGKTRAGFGGIEDKPPSEPRGEEGRDDRLAGTVLGHDVHLPDESRAHPPAPGPGAPAPEPATAPPPASAPAAAPPAVPGMFPAVAVLPPSPRDNDAPLATATELDRSSPPPARNSGAFKLSQAATLVAP